MGVTSNQISKRRDGCRIAGLVAAVALYDSAFAFYDADGYLVHTTGGGVNRFAGVVIDGVDNSAGSPGDVAAEIWRESEFEVPGTGFTQATVGKPIYASDNYTATEEAAGNSWIGECTEYISSTRIRVKLHGGDAGQAVRKLVSQELAVGDFTDNANTTGFIDFTSQLPANCLVLGWKAEVTGAFAGDTSAVIQVGTTDVDKFTADATQSAFTTGTRGSAAAAATAYQATAVAPRVTITGNSDFTAIKTQAGGVMTVTIYYITLN